MFIATLWRAVLSPSLWPPKTELQSSKRRGLRGNTLAKNSVFAIEDFVDLLFSVVVHGGDEVIFVFYGNLFIHG